MVAQQNCRVDAALADVDAHACEGLAGVCAHEEDVADFCGFGVFFGEEAPSSAGGVEGGELLLLEGL